MAKTKIEVDLVVKGTDSVGQAEGKVFSLKKELKLLKDLMRDGIFEGDELEQVAKRAGVLQDKLSDVNQRVKNLASDSQKLDGFVNLTQGIVGGFAAVQGLTAAFGAENEDLQKTMVKLQGTMSALQGIQAISNLLQKESAGMIALTSIKTWALTTAMKAQSFVMAGATNLAKGLRAALLATGVGALVVAVTTLIPLISDWMSGTEGQEKAQKKLNDELEDSNQLLDDYTGQVSYQTKKQILEAKALGASNDLIRAIEKDGRDRDLKLLQDDYNKKLKLRKDAAKLTMADFLIAQQAVDEASRKLQAKYDANELANLEAENESRKEILEQNKEWDEKEKARQDKLREQIKAKNEKNNADLEKYYQARKKIIDEANKLIEQQYKTEREKEYDDIDRDYTEKLAVVGEGTKEETALREAWFIERQSLTKKFTDQDIKDNEAKNAKLKADNDKAQADGLKSYKETQQAKLQITSDTFSIMNNLGEIFIGQQYKQTQIGKALALVEIAIDTARAISSLTAASEANPANEVTYGLAGVGQFISGLARITSNVLRAKNVLNSGNPTSGGGGGSSSGAGAAPPSSKVFIPQSQTDLDKKEQRVYVLEKDITDKQGRVARIKSNAELI